MARSVYNVGLQIGELYKLIILKDFLVKKESMEEVQDY